MNTELIRKLYNSSQTIRKRFSLQNRSIEEKSEEDLDEEETAENESSSENEEHDAKKSLLKRVDSTEQSPPPIQLILHDMSDSFATLL
jgi:hypothetical protein